MSLEDQWQTSEFKHDIKVLINAKPQDKSILKALEELAELSEKLLKFINKPGTVSEDDITEEIADCEMHFYLLKKIFPVPASMREKKIKKMLASKDYVHYSNKYETEKSKNEKVKKH